MMALPKLFELGAINTRCLLAVLNKLLIACFISTEQLCKHLFDGRHLAWSSEFESLIRLLGLFLLGKVPGQTGSLDQIFV